MTRLWSNLDPAAVVRNCPASEIEAILRDAVAEIVALQDCAAVVAWLMGKSQRYHDEAARCAKVGDAEMADAYIQGSATLAAAASDIKQGLHHD